MTFPKINKKKMLYFGIIFYNNKIKKRNKKIFYNCVSISGFDGNYRYKFYNNRKDRDEELKIYRNKK